MDKVKKVFFWAWGLFVIALFIGGIVTAIYYPIYSGWTKFGTMFYVILFFFILIGLIGQLLDLDTDVGYYVVITMFALSFFFMSWGNLLNPPGKYAAVSTNGETKLISGSYFGVPYGKSFTYIGNQKYTLDIAVETDEGLLTWEASVKLKIDAPYDKAFQLLGRCASAEGWLAEVQSVAEQGMEKTVKNADFRESGWRSFEMPEEYRERLAQLGYETEEVKIGHLRYIRK